jgi:hypothetical protein
MRTLEKLLFLSFISVFIGTCGYKHVATEPLLSEYSEGERTGIIRKLSKKGYMYKTFEGELMMNGDIGGMKLDTFLFSVPSLALARAMQATVGVPVVLSYKQGAIVPYKAGESQYRIVKFKVRGSKGWVTPENAISYTEALKR